MVDSTPQSLVYWNDKILQRIIAFILDPKERCSIELTSKRLFEMSRSTESAISISELSIVPSKNNRISFLLGNKLCWETASPDKIIKRLLLYYKSHIMNIKIENIMCLSSELIQLSFFPNVQSLRLQGSVFDEDPFTKFHVLESLKKLELCLESDEDFDTCVAFMDRMSSIEKLILKHGQAVNLTAQRILAISNSIRKLPHLKVLVIADAMSLFTQQMFYPVKAKLEFHSLDSAIIGPTVEYLKISGPYEDTYPLSQAISFFHQRLSTEQLKHFTLCNIIAPQELFLSILDALTSSENLEVLKLDTVESIDERKGFNFLKLIQGSITRLYLRNLYISRSNFHDLIEYSPNLTHLTLINLPEINQNVLSETLPHFHNLECLNTSTIVDCLFLSTICNREELPKLNTVVFCITYSNPGYTKVLLYFFYKNIEVSESNEYNSKVVSVSQQKEADYLWDLEAMASFMHTMDVQLNNVVKPIKQTHFPVIKFPNPGDYNLEDEFEEYELAPKRRR